MFVLYLHKSFSAVLYRFFPSLPHIFPAGPAGNQTACSGADSRTRTEWRRLFCSRSDRSPGRQWSTPAKIYHVSLNRSGNLSIEILWSNWLIFPQFPNIAQLSECLYVYLRPLQRSSLDWIENFSLTELPLLSHPCIRWSRLLCSERRSHLYRLSSHRQHRLSPGPALCPLSVDKREWPTNYFPSSKII